MSKGLLGCGAVLLVLVVMAGGLFLWGTGVYNRLVGLDEGVKTAWSQVENTYQRRADLIPNLVKTVEGAADFERATLTEVIEARAKATSIQITPQDLTNPEALARYQQAQDSLSSALSRLMVVVERYPELKANQNFLQLQDELAGTENRIAVERKRFNEVAQGYNTARRSFPKNLIAQWFGFGEAAYFEAAEGAEQAPKVEFDFRER
ncbi:MAG TPA: LemA family protein [Vicinamibacteria bacterium]|nr:LemA family protein [Vicinamibacteria bacterium]